MEDEEVRALGRKWLKEDLSGPRRGRSKALGRAGSKDTKWVKVRINNEETEIRSNNRKQGGKWISEDV